MISYVTGIIDTVEADKVIVDYHGIGLGIFMPQNALEMLGEGEKVKIYTYFSVREDAMQLFGFLTKDELKFFKLLIGVSGVGPKGALNIISVCPNDALLFAIVSEDIGAIAKASGIGKKTAQKIIIELKDKLDMEEFLGAKGDFDILPQSREVQSDAVEALVALGYSQSDALQAVGRVKNRENMETEEILKAALKNIF